MGHSGCFDNSYSGSLNYDGSAEVNINVIQIVTKALMSCQPCNVRGVELSFPLRRESYSSLIPDKPE